MDRPQHDTQPFVRNNKRRNRRGAAAQGRRQDLVPLTDEGLPAATPDAPPVSPVVFVSDESRGRFPWLPGRVIAGSVWRGPQNECVRVDENGRAEL